jgi:hypothetical protein
LVDLSRLVAAAVPETAELALPEHQVVGIVEGLPEPYRIGLLERQEPQGFRAGPMLRREPFQAAVAVAAQLAQA